MTDNPYAPPKTHVEDVLDALPEGDFLPDGRSVEAGRGWSWIADVWAFTAGQRLVFIGVILLFCIVQFGLNFIPLLGPIASTFLFPFLVAGLAIGCDAVRRGEPLEVGHLFAGFQRHTNKLLLVGAVSFAMYILMAIVMIAMLGVTVGMAFLGGAPPTGEQLDQIIVPVLLAVLVALALSVPVTMALLFVPPLVVLNDYEVFPAVRASFVACLKNVLPFLIWGIAGAVLWFFSTLLLIIVGWFLVGSLLMVSLYLSYRDIFYEA
jgi:hypothetical protein